jgi:hypothetical protein
LPDDPCLFPEGATSVVADGAKTVVPAASPTFGNRVNDVRREETTYAAHHD